MSKYTPDSKNATERLDHTNKRTLCRLYWEDGLSFSEIADKCGVSKGGVQYWFREYDLPTRDKTEAHAKAMDRGRAAFETTTNGYERSRSNGDVVAIHRLVAVAECGIDAVKGNHVHHKNEVKWDNRPENLEVLTAGDHMSEHKEGEKTSKKLSKTDVLKILDELEQSDKTHKQIASEYGVSRSMVSQINLGERWRHLQD